MADKRSTGPNARPKDESIARSGSGFPNDTGRLPQDVEDAVENADEEAARRSLDALDERDRKTRPKTP